MGGVRCYSDFWVEAVLTRNQPTRSQAAPCSLHLTIGPLCKIPATDSLHPGSHSCDPLLMCAWMLCILLTWKINLHSGQAVAKFRFVKFCCGFCPLRGLCSRGKHIRNHQIILVIFSSFEPYVSEGIRSSNGAGALGCLRRVTATSGVQEGEEEEG